MRDSIGAVDDPAARGAEHDLSRLDLVEYRLDERGFDGRVGFVEAVVLGDGQFDGAPCRCPVEVIDAEVVLEEARNAPLEAVELREGVFAHADEEARAQVLTVDRPGELDGEGAFAVLLGVVEKVLLELVEDDDEVALDPLAPEAEGVDEGALCWFVRCAIRGRRRPPLSPPRQKGT